MKVLFLGSPKFSVAILKRLMNSKHEVVAVVTQPDKPCGRGHKLSPTEIKKFAIENNIKYFDFPKISEHIDELKELDFDISVTASFGQILKQSFLSLSPCINVHPSLLPKYRGATPIQTALLNGDKTTGVTIMKVVSEVDAGDIYNQKKISIEENDNYTSLEDKLANLGGDMLVEILDDFEKGQAKAVPQDEKKATFCKKIQKEDCHLNLEMNARQLINKSKAFNEYGVYIFIDNERLKVGEIRDVSLEYFSLQKGEVSEEKKRFVVGCDGGAIEILTCMSKSGKYISGRDFLNGFDIKRKIIR